MQGSYNTTIVVQDNHGESASSNFVLSVINAVPISTPIQDQTAKLGSVFSFVVPSTTFQDADGDPLTLAATKSDGSALPTWLTFNL